MTDRELLAMAARAMGTKYVVEHFGYYVDALSDDQIRRWNSLTNNGDALRLAVERRMNVKHDDPNAVTVGWTEFQQTPITSGGTGPWYWKEWLSDHDGDRMKATRYAITRAAASEIGKATP